MTSQTFSTWGRWGGDTQVPSDTLPSDFTKDQPLKAFMGWDGLFVHDQTVNLVDMARAYMEKAREESCGQCFPCRLGTKR